MLVRLRKLPSSDPRVQAEWISIRTEAIHSRRAFAQRHPELSSKLKSESSKEGAGVGWGMFADLKREWAGWVEMFGPEVIKRTHVGMGIMFFQQFVGINALIYYRQVTCVGDLSDGDDMLMWLTNPQSDLIRDAWAGLRTPALIVGDYERRSARRGHDRPSLHRAVREEDVVVRRFDRDDLVACRRSRYDR